MPIPRGETVKLEDIALHDILEERHRQDAQWGVPDHSPFVWGAILMEEVGEYYRAALEDKPMDMHREAVQVAAVALAIVESITRVEVRRLEGEVKA
jgi:hypothetical protein